MNYSSTIGLAGTPSADLDDYISIHGEYIPLREAQQRGLVHVEGTGPVLYWIVNSR